MKTNTSSVQEALKDTVYPAEKRGLVEHARLHNASEDVLDDIISLPDKVYTSAEKLTRNLKAKNKLRATNLNRLSNNQILGQKYVKIEESKTLK